MRAFQLASAAALGVAAGVAQAAPLPVWTSGAPAAQMASGAMSNVTPVADRRCWWHNGHRHCRRLAWRAPGYGYKAAGSDYYEQDARTLPVGSQRWWDIKDREGSTGRP
ncbi:MAG: hypothetical protein J2P51_01965 [Hyphomicrobiaceae bacterium]|nr:hypothetical protein [Hyphomicrobiaceae bacterium]